MDYRIECQIEGEEDTPLTDAHAFRILDDVGEAFYLMTTHDFGHEVVMRLVIPRGTLAAVRDRLVTDVVEFTTRTVH